MKSVIGFLLLICTCPAFAVQSLVCKKPSPEFIHEELRLLPNASGTYDVDFVFVVHASLPENVHPENDPATRLASNLTCAFNAAQPLLIRCDKSSLVDNEKSNSYFSPSLIDETFVGQDGQMQVTHKVKFAVFSPYTNYEARGEGPFNVEGTMYIDFLPSQCVAF